MTQAKSPFFNSRLPDTFYRLLCSTYLGHHDRWSLLTALGGKIPSPVLLKHALKPRNFFTEQKTVTTISIPKAPISNENPLDNIFVSQLRNGRLIYCYPNGTIALYSRESPTANPEYFSLLPEAKTVAIHELPDERLLLTLKDQQPHLVDLKKTPLQH